MKIKMLYNEEVIELTVSQLQESEAAKTRWRAAKILGDMGRSKNSDLQKRVLRALENACSTDEDPDVRHIASQSLLEIEGKFDETSEKYKPQELRGSLRDQYYLKRG
jgi:HEAT repeat protein